MAFDPGALDWASHKHHSPGEPIWGDDLGDRSFLTLWEASLAADGRAKVDAQIDALNAQRERERWARIHADATRRRSAPAEARIERERVAKAGTFGKLLAQAMGKAKQRSKKR